MRAAWFIGLTTLALAVGCGDDTTEGSGTTSGTTTGGGGDGSGGSPTTTTSTTTTGGTGGDDLTAVLACGEQIEAARVIVDMLADLTCGGAACDPVAPASQECQACIGGLTTPPGCRTELLAVCEGGTEAAPSPCAQGLQCLQKIECQEMACAIECTSDLGHGPIPAADLIACQDTLLAFAGCVEEQGCAELCGFSASGTGGGGTGGAGGGI